MKGTNKFLLNGISARRRTHREVHCNYRAYYNAGNWPIIATSDEEEKPQFDRRRLYICTFCLCKMFMTRAIMMIMMML